MEFTDEEKAEYERRVKEREARRQREDAEQATRKQAKATGPFKSRIGRGIAGALSKTADTAEGVRARADYLGNQAGRIKKAVTPPARKHGPVPKQLRPFQYKPVRQARRGVRHVVRAPPVYRAPAYQMPPQRDPFVDMIEGPRDTRSTSDIINEFTMGRPSGNGKKGRDFFKDMLG